MSFKQARNRIICVFRKMTRGSMEDRWEAGRTAESCK